ncbi:MAG: asparagine synthase (glutamine-hydrolyzing), partial [Phycisphaerales bacterium]
PMVDAATGCAIAFNGEIYNYRSLQTELVNDGVVFSTTSDTEVLLQLLIRDGEACLDRLEGMFAFAFWDARSSHMLLARDRFGEKPLFTSTLADGTLVAASEPSVLAESLSPSSGISDRGLGQFLALGYTLGEDTLWSNIRRLRPGHVLERSERGIRIKRFADVVDGSTGPTLLGRPTEYRIGRILDESVESELVSDVPIGVFLSGGIDSSLVAAAAAHARPDRPIQAFGLGFGDPEFDETTEARRFAEANGIAFHREQLELGGDDFEVSIRWAAREPIADSSMLPMWLLARFARQHVTVALSGDGGDELFGGYETYVATQLHQHLRHLPPFIVSALRYMANTLVPVRHGKVGIDYKLRQFLDGLHLAPSRAHHHWRLLFSRTALASLMNPDAREWVAASEGLDEFERAWNECPDTDPIARAMYTDMHTWLPCDILVKVDRATMAHSLESRAPFLHPRMASAAWSLTRRERVSGRKTKIVLRRLAARRLGIEVAGRPKRGFNAPVSRWFADEGLSFAQARLATPSMRQLFRPEALDCLIREHTARRNDHGYRILALCVLAEWLHGVGSSQGSTHK